MSLLKLAQSNRMLHEVNVDDNDVRFGTKVKNTAENFG